VDEGSLAIIGTLYLEKWFAGDAKRVQLAIDTNPNGSQQ